MKDFELIYEPHYGVSSLGRQKTEVLYQHLLTIESIEGNLAEVGVYQGRTARFIKRMCPDRKLFLYDTFSGLVGADPSIDGHRDGDFFDTSLELVKDLVGEENVVYKVGKFPETFAEHNEKFAFVHSDTDTYYGTWNSLILFIPILEVRGKIIFDDFGWKDCPGVQKAIYHWLEQEKPNNIDFRIRGNQYIMEKVQ